MRTYLHRRFLLCLGLVAAREVGASYLPPTWQQEVAQSDFVGIVECERAGYGLGLVKVVDSWKGAPAGSRFMLSVESDPIHPVRGLLLTGRKYLLMANRLRQQRPKELGLFGTPYSPTSLSRREAQYGAGIFWRWVLLPSDDPLKGKIPLGLVGGHDSAANLKRDVLRFLALSASDREKEALQAVFVQRLPRDYSRPGRPLRPDVVPLAEKIERATSVEAVLRIIFKPGQGEIAAHSAIHAGGAITLAALLRGSPPQSILGPHVVRSVLQHLCSQYPELATNLDLRPKWSPAEELQRMQGALSTIRPDLSPQSSNPRLRELPGELLWAQTPAAVVQTISLRGPEIEVRMREQWTEVIVAGGPEALRALEAILPEDFGLGGELWEWCRAVLRLQLGLPAAPRKYSGCDDRVGGEWWLGQASAGQIRQWQEQLAGKDDGKYMAAGYWPSQAFSRLTCHEPASAVDWMLRRPTEAGVPPNWPDVSAFAGYFADFCHTNRAKFLGRLLAAPHPSVRAIAASVLADDNPVTALPVLRELRNAPDGPGDLACFQLARRGDKAAMARLIELLRPPVYTSTNRPLTRTTFVWPVAEETKALLSNSAKTSDVPQPGEDYPGWWATYRERVRLADPWLAESIAVQ